MKHTLVAGLILGLTLCIANKAIAADGGVDELRRQNATLKKDLEDLRRRLSAQERKSGLVSRMIRSPGRGKDAPLKRVLIHAILIVTTLVVVFPVLRVFSTALRPGDRMLDTNLSIIPEGATRREDAPDPGNCPF